MERTLFHENGFQLLKWINSFRFDLEKLGIGRVHNEILYV